MLGDEFFEFISMSLFEVEGRGSSVSVANGSKLEIDVMGKWSDPRPERVRHSHVGAK